MIVPTTRMSTNSSSIICDGLELNSGDGLELNRGDGLELNRGGSYAFISPVECV